MLRFHTTRRIRGSADRRRLEKVTEFFLAEFPSSADQLAGIRERLERPLRVDRHVALITAEEADGSILGFALVDHFPAVGLSYLEYLVTGPRARGRGVGGGIYETVREGLVADGSNGLIFETNADDEDLPQEDLRGHAATLRFYEKYDARPVDGVRFDYPPFAATPRLILVYDALGLGGTLDGATLREFIRNLYRVKYKVDLRDPGVKRIIAAVPEGPLALRSRRYVRRPSPAARQVAEVAKVRVEAVIPDVERTHVAPRPRLDRPARAERLLQAIKDIPFVTSINARHHADRHLYPVHTRAYVNFLRETCRSLSEGQIITPRVFPRRDRTRAPTRGVTHAGYFALDDFTPLTRDAYAAARAAVDVALTATDRVLAGSTERPVYALTRPPGHHAEADMLGGFCYLNSAAIAAQSMIEAGERVAFIDIDAHHANGTQRIFYERDDVFTASIHGDPATTYPYFSGYSDEVGEGAGKGHNLNVPLPESADDAAYLRALDKVVRRVREFEPSVLIVPFGLDASKDDPSGPFRITKDGFVRIARTLAGLRLPTLITQEGGYAVQALDANLDAFLSGWASPTKA